MATLRAPFNFVPLNDKIYSPDWANQISQDIPFSDGLSGIIDVTISAESPIFIKNGEAQSREEDKSGKHYEFSHTKDGRYFIPATSIKGAIRSVLEIISFGKMTQVQNQSFGIRALNGPDYNFYKEVIKPGNIHCGWLRKVGNNFYIDDCGIPYRISAETIAKKFSKDFLTFIKGEDENRKLSKDENKTARTKYKLLKGFDLHQRFSLDYGHKDPYDPNKKFVVFGDEFSGTIVFTGQPSPRKYSMKKKRMEGKIYEFVFKDNVEEYNILVNPFVIKEFEKIHQNSPDYNDKKIKDKNEKKLLLKNKLYAGERIPVFFSKRNNEIDSIGISYMYKYPAYNSIYDGIPDELLSNEKLDLAECIFGYTDKNEGLKGRVQIAHAFLKGKPVFAKEKELALSTPHPSYYPLYLGNGKSWNSDTIQLAGRKRYPIRNEVKDNNGTDGMKFFIKPLNKGSKFEGKVMFHNLRPIELGALLNALNFWNEKNCYHNLGQGKPLGYGTVKIDASINYLRSITDNYSKNSDFISIFQSEMEANIANWEGSVQLRELRLMALRIKDKRDEEFTYMNMSTRRDDNEFYQGLQSYNKGEQLGLYSEIIDKKVRRISFAGNVGTDRQRSNKEEKLAKEEEKRAREKERIDNLDKTIEKARQMASLKKYTEFIKLMVENPEIKTMNEFKDVISIISEKKQQALQIASVALTLEKENKYVEAIEKYIEAQSYGFTNYEKQIEACKNKKEMMEEQTLATKASELLKEGNYKEAKEKFEVAQEFGRNDYKEQIELCNENLRQNIEAVIIAEAKDFRQKKMFDEAIAKYKEAQELGFYNYAAQILECENEKRRADLAKGNIIDYIKTLTINSPASFANGLKKKYTDQNIPEEDLEKIANVLKDKADKIKSWKDTRKWKDVPKHIGKENSDKLYHLIF